jgi:hypothetical protein
LHFSISVFDIIICLLIWGNARVTLQRVGGHHLLTPHPQLVNSASASTGKGPDYFLDLLKQFNLPV